MNTIEIPNPKIQIPNKSQVPSSNGHECETNGLLSPALSSTTGREGENEARNSTIRVTKPGRDGAHGVTRPTSVETQEAEPWPEAVDGLALLDGLRDMVKRFVVVPAWAVETLALWILHTYAYELRDVSTYIGIESPERQCGKTTLLTVLSELVNRPVVSSNVSPPALFRAIEELRPTLLIDEADTFLKGNDEFRGILNAGYTRKTAFVLRVANQAPESSKLQAPSTRETPNSKTQSTHTSEENDTSSRPSPLMSGEGGGNGWSRLARFSCWCPKVMCSIGHLPETLADRCIVIRMQRKRNDEECERLRNLEATVLKQQCARFVMDHAEAIATARPEMPESLNDRATDIWEPLLALADLAGGHWPDTSRKAAESLSARAQQGNPIGSLLLDIYILFEMNKVDRMFTRTLIEGLNDHHSRPWEELLRPRDATARDGARVTDMWLSQQLRPYGVKPRTIWIGGGQAKGYRMEDLEDVFRRYVPRSEWEALKAEWAEERRERAEKSQIVT